MGLDNAAPPVVVGEGGVLDLNEAIEAVVGIGEGVCWGFAVGAVAVGIVLIGGIGCGGELVEWIIKVVSCIFLEAVMMGVVGVFGGKGSGFLDELIEKVIGIGGAFFLIFGGAGVAEGVTVGIKFGDFF